MTRYEMPARSQGKLYAQRRPQAKRYTHRWVFVHSLTPEVEYAVRKWLLTRLNCFYCDLQAMYTPRLHPANRARTHIVLDNTPPLQSMARNDEAVEVDARNLNARDAVKTLTKATGLDPHLSVFGWPFCLDELDDVEEGCATGISCTPAPHMHDTGKER